MKYLIIFFLLIYSIDAISQKFEKFNFYAGAKLRVTPFFLNKERSNLVISVGGKSQILI